ncbi:MAG TPA: hypothetical protein VFQ61_22460, partial [Polyangiaceae bacterium]|nr:hypothetical protein [Polyangiaceae bacterium]
MLSSARRVAAGSPPEQPASQLDQRRRHSSLELILAFAILAVLGFGGLAARELVGSSAERRPHQRSQSNPSLVAPARAPAFSIGVSPGAPVPDETSAKLSALPSTPTSALEFSAAPLSIPFHAPHAEAQAESELLRGPQSAAFTAKGITQTPKHAGSPNMAERVLWKHRGLCGDDDSDPNNPRNRYLREFGQLPASWSKGLFAYPNAPAEVIEQVRREVPSLPSRVQAFLGLTSEPPAVYVHRDPQALRDYSCVNATAVAYYDGNMHVSLSGGIRFRQELTISLEHEYVHHALMSHGVGQPIWFQEGAAMVFAQENWEDYRFTTQLIPLESMSRAFAHTAKPEGARAFYLQAYAMVRLLRAVWRDPARSSEHALLDALLAQQATPEGLFEWALEQRMGHLER